jgi:hypothetical protein
LLHLRLEALKQRELLLQHCLQPAKHEAGGAERTEPPPGRSSIWSPPHLAATASMPGRSSGLPLQHCLSSSLHDEATRAWSHARMRDEGLRAGAREHVTGQQAVSRVVLATGCVTTPQCCVGHPSSC